MVPYRSAVVTEVRYSVRSYASTFFCVVTSVRSSVPLLRKHILLCRSHGGTFCVLITEVSSSVL